MKIGVDIRPLQTGHQYRGIGIYTRSLVEAMVTLAPEHHFVLFMYADLPQPLVELEGENFEYRTISGKPPVGIEAEFFRSFQTYFTAQTEDLDVYLQPSVEFGRPKNCPSYCTMHDLIPLIFRPDYYPFFVPRSPKQLKKLIITLVNYIKYRVQLSHYNKFDGLIANSEATRRDVKRILHYRKPVGLAILTGNPKTLRAAHEAPSNAITKPFIMYAGGNDAYKNVDGLIESFQRLGLDDLQLVISGKEFGNRYPNVTNLIEINFPSDEQLGWLFAHAEAYVLPSIYEGFGMPALEAMQAGCPVICYDNSSLPEVVGDAAIVLKTGEPFDEAIRRVHTDPKLRTELHDKGLARAATFSWERTARETLAVLTGTHHEG